MLASWQYIRHFKCENTVPTQNPNFYVLAPPKQTTSLFVNKLGKHDSALPVIPCGVLAEIILGRGEILQLGFLGVNATSF
jgi:hypothetical protein